MIEDEIVREVRAAREAFAAAHGYDIRAMVAALQAFDAGDGRRVVRLEPRRVATVARPSPSAESADEPFFVMPRSAGNSIADEQS